CHGHAWSIYFRDPEGNRIEVYCDTPWYVHQPIREEMDFDLPEAEILKRSEALARSLPGFKPGRERARASLRFRISASGRSKSISSRIGWWTYQGVSQ